MGQVPEHQSRRRILIVGDGRMASHTARYFKLKNIPFTTWSRSTSITQNLSFQSAAAQADVVLLLISDKAIEPFAAESARELTGKVLIHFSGSLVTGVAHGMHPLMTFGASLYDLPVYESIPFVVERGGPVFSEIFPQLSNPVFEIEKSQRPLYHALCVLAGNFTTMLWAKATSDFEKQLGLPREIMMAYARRTLENVLQDGYDALTGPLVRGDFRTIDSNLAALDSDPFQGVYEAFVQAHGRLQSRNGIPAQPENRAHAPSARLHERALTEKDN